MVQGAEGAYRDWCDTFAQTCGTQRESRPASTMFGYNEFTPAFRRFLIAVSLSGPALAVAIASQSLGSWSWREAILAGLLTALAALAERFSVNLTHHTHIMLNTAVYVAMLLLVPWTAVGVLAFVAILVSKVFHYGLRNRLYLPEIFFNIGQSTLYVTTGALCFGLLNRLIPTPRIDDLGSIPAIVGGAIVMHLVNTGLVAVPSAEQAGSSPWRVWRQSLQLDLLPHLVLTAVGVIAAIVIDGEPWVLPLVLLPGVLLHRAVQQSIQLRRDTRQALASLVEIIELRDPYTAGHSRRVAQTARAISESLGLTAEEADLIESAGRVHDLGKVAIDPQVLTKTGKLDDDEWVQMKKHPVFSADVVAQFAAYQEGTTMVRAHHERWDGLGYPDGLAGEAIPLGARILAVADTFDALTSDRPYRKGMELGRATAILREGAGTQWDARVVEAFLRVLSETPERIPLDQKRAEVVADEPTGVASREAVVASAA
jgi:hypothetical protein